MLYFQPKTRVYSQSWTDSKYTVESGGSTVSVSMTPLASFSGGTVANKSDSYLYGNAKITYKAHVYVPFIDFGTSVNASKQALTGQQIGAHLNTNGAPITIHSYTWSSSGGTAPNPIKNWDPNGKAADGVTLQQLFPLTSVDLTGTDTSTDQTGITVADLNFYDQVADTVTVKCVVNFTFPKDNKGNAKSGSVTVTAKPITFLKPTASWTAVQAGVADDPDLSRFEGSEAWQATVTVPSPFTGGTAGYAQIISPNRYNTRVPNPGKPDKYYYSIQQTNNDGSKSWVLPGSGLDGYFPYQWELSLTTGQGVFHPTGYTWDVSATGNGADTPASGYTQTDIDGGGNDWRTAFAGDTFQTWLMFKPSSTGAIWVPLQQLGWSWTATATKNLTTGKWTTTGSVTTPDHGTVTDTPPAWSKVIQANDQYHPLGPSN